MLKLQSFFVFKFKTSRLKLDNYRIDITVSQARLNGEIVRLGDSSMFEELRRILKRDFEYSELQKIEREISKVKKLRNSKNNRERLEKLQYSLDKMLYFPEIANIVFDDNRHYKHIINKGLFINGIRYKRLLSGAGMARRQTVLFIQEHLWEKMHYFMNCGVPEDFFFNHQKWNSYYALASSAGHKIDTPRFCVIPDYEVEREIQVDFVTENPNPKLDPLVEENKTILQKFNIFDGEGMCSPSFANQIAYNLELDYTPASAIFRSAFLKGLIVTFDFKEYAERTGKFEVKDIYGKSHDIRNLDVILTASQFKLSEAYRDFDHYLQEVEKRNYGWRITRVSPKVDKNKTTSSYMYLQPLNLNKEQIRKMCEPTIQYLKNVSGLDYNSIILYLIGSLNKKEISKEWFDKLEPYIKVLFYEPSLINDSYIQNKLRRMLTRRIRDSYIGILDLVGNYQFLIVEPLALAQHALGVKVEGILKEDQFYSRYWNERGVSEVSAMRSPLTWESEANVFNLVKNEDTEYWYKYLNSGIVLNVHKDVSMNLGGSD